MSKRKLLALVGVMVILAMVLAACGGDEEAETETEDISGQTVTILTAAGEEQIAKFKESMAPFEERTGVTVEIEGSGDFETLALVRAEAGDPPDIYNFPQPGLMAGFARDDFLIDLGEFLDDDYMQEQY
ncbi:MAG TPA: extracellular solute-binding protein, partial [Anaerolineae bacterium]|nr:extracellular solute-binding protein [Anaerolineae bacterium]